MTKDEFGKLSSVIKTIYPSELPNKAAIAIWYKLLSNIPYHIAIAAFEDWAKHNHFPPKPADFISFAEKISLEFLESEEQYYEKVQRYLENHSRKELTE